MSLQSFAAVGILVVLAFVSLVLLFSDDSVSGLAQFSISRCSIPAGFEAEFTSRNDCLNALPALCSDACPNWLSECVSFSKRQCSFVGRHVGGAFA